jgi:acyl-CoA thioester hydrolase
MNGGDFFVSEHRVNFHETDAMGVVHHANYLKYFEQARVDWINSKGLREFHYPYAALTLAVLETSTRHFRSAYFNDLLKIRLQVRREKLKVRFRYGIYSDRYEEPICTGEVLLVPLNQDNKPTRLPEKLAAVLEKEKWIETWPLNS